VEREPQPAPSFASTALSFAATTPSFAQPAPSFASTALSFAATTSSLDQPALSIASTALGLAVEWEPNVVRFYLDSTLYETRTNADVPAGASWVYHHPFFLLLNVAVGGTWPGSPNGSTSFPQQMLVDYVRVYQR
jgi:hypothetical protein